MMYENVCGSCGNVRRMRQQKSARLCGSCARSLVWEARRLAALHDLVHRARDIVSVLEVMLRHSAGAVTYTDALTLLERDVARLADDVMVAQLSASEKGVAA